METRIVGEPRQFYRKGSEDLRMVGKRSAEWNPNDWKWDGDLFTATPSVPADGKSRQLFPVTPSSIPESRGFSNSSASCSDEVILEADKGKRESEKRRRAIVIEDDNLNDGSSNLTLKLGGCTSEQREDWEETGEKKTKTAGSSSSRAVCQVEGCESDLTKAKDYHRRHKVCETHSKATKAIVGNVIQRFCQQCSRFHALQEFDEGKRSCRRRLAGHNKRRRKTQPETTANGNHGDDQASGHLILNLLKILTNMHSNIKSDETKDQDLLSRIMETYATKAGAPGEHTLLNLQGLIAAKTTSSSEMVSALLSNGVHPPISNHLPGPSSQLPDRRASEKEATPQPNVVFPMKKSPPGCSDAGACTAGHTKMNNFDLNDAYIESDGDMENLERSTVPVNLGAGSFGCPLWLQKDGQQTSPPQTSRNSDSTSTASPSSSNGDAQSRTDRIVFKIFGKEPNDFPIGLRMQILNWVSHSPSDIESFIRPGCVVLTIYLRLDDSEWEELCDDLSSSLSRLLDASEESFWRTGWVYVRVQHQTAFIYNGEVVLDASFPLERYNYSHISSVTPIALSITEKAQFSIKGLNLSRPPTRLLCALEGKYLIEDNSSEQDAASSLEEHDEFQRVTFSCSIPTVMGRGFFEVEDDDGLSSSFFPFLVAENDICSEIRALENAIDLPADEEAIGSDRLDAKILAMEFICEMGWLFHRCQLKSRLGDSDPNTDLFPLKRFKWLMDFSMDRDWCAVVKKLLGIMLNGVVSSEEHPSLATALADMGLLHRAVRRNSRPLVQLLLRYVPEECCKREDEHVPGPVDDKGNKSFLFTPDAAGPAGLTPLHIAAGRDGSENVLEDLLDDPGKVGIHAWKNSRDITGFTPEDYARLRGHYSYIHMVQKKLNKRPGSGQVVLDIPGALIDYKSNRKPNNDNTKSTTGFDVEKCKSKPTPKSCKLCQQKTLGYGNMTSNRSLVYRPAMLSMVAIAAVCVCVALLFKSSPEVLFVFGPFRWEALDYGTV